MNTPIAPDAALEAEVLSVVDESLPRLQSLLATLVGFPSLLGQEASAQDFMQGLFRGMGLAVDRFQVRDDELNGLPGYSPAVGHWDHHDNVVGRHVPRGAKGRSLILNGHIDVVPIGAEELWTAPPFEPRVEGDRLYGRGAGDMKAGIAAYVIAFESLRALGLQAAAPVFMQSVVEEECTGNGALACVHRGYRADAALIPEPFQHTLLCAQVGVMWLQLEVLGRPAHVMSSTDGINAIEAAYALYQGLQGLAAEWNEPRNRHPAFADVLNPIRLNLGKIHGGEWASSVPTRCVAELRIGFYPGVNAAQIRTAVEERLRHVAASDPRLPGVQYRVHYTGFQAEGCTIDAGHPLIATLASAHERVVGTSAQSLASIATTDARVFNLYGDTPATCYGPEASNIHGIDESVSLESTRRVAGVIALFLARWCGVEQA